MSAIQEKESFELFGAVPYFDGESNGVQVDEFLDKIDWAGSLQNWKDETKITIAKMKLKGKARLAVKHCNLFKDVTWDKFKEELAEYYSLPPREVENLMKNCTQRRHETVRDGSWRFMEIASKCGRFCVTPEGHKMFKGAIEQETWCPIYIRNIDQNYYSFFLTKTWENEGTGETVKLSDIVNQISKTETETERTHGPKK